MFGNKVPSNFSSFPEIAKHDLPAFVNFIRNTTSNQKLAYVGHSMGTTVMWYAMATNPEFIHESVSIFIALGPVSKTGNIHSQLLRKLSGHLKMSMKTLNFMGYYEHTSLKKVLM